MDDFEYVMHGLVYKYKRDDSQGVGTRVEVSGSWKGANSCSCSAR